MIDFSNPSSFVPFLKEHKLNITQLFLIGSLYREKYGEILDYAMNVKRIQLSDVEELIERNIVLAPPSKSLKEVLVNLDLLEVNKSFAEQIFVNNQKAAMEFWEAYPATLDVNGQRHNARNYPLEDFTTFYGELISTSKFQHQRMIDALNYAKDNDILNMAMHKYFSTGFYMTVISEMESKKSRKPLSRTRVL